MYNSVIYILHGEILSWASLVAHGFEYDHYLLQGEWKSPKFRRSDLRAGVWGVSLDAGRGSVINLDLSHPALLLGGWRRSIP